MVTTFDDHIINLCRKTSQKLYALSRVASHISFDKKRILLKKFVISQFNYYPLVWMCHSRSLNNRISNSHERALRTEDKKIRILKICLKMRNLSKFTWETYIILLLKFTKLPITFLQKLWEIFFTFKKMRTAT